MLAVHYPEKHRCIVSVSPGQNTALRRLADRATWAGQSPGVQPMALIRFPMMDTVSFPEDSLLLAV